MGIVAIRPISPSGSYQPRQKSLRSRRAALSSQTLPTVATFAVDFHVKDVRRLHRVATRSLLTQGLGLEDIHTELLAETGEIDIAACVRAILAPAIDAIRTEARCPIGSEEVYLEPAAGE